MQIVSYDMAKMLIDNDVENTCVISKYDSGIDTGYILRSTLENRELNDYPLGYIMNGYGKYGWYVTEDEMTDLLNVSNNILIGAIVEQQGYVCGDMYLFDENPLESYLNAETYGVDEIVYIYATNNEIISWLPYLTCKKDSYKTIAYCFIIQPEEMLREKYFREQEHNYHREDAKYAVNEYFSVNENDVPKDILKDEDELEDYKYCMENLDDVIAHFEHEQNSEVGDYYVWQNAVKAVIDERL